MRKMLITVAILSGLLLLTTSAGAISLGVSSETAAVAGTVDVDITISGLGVGAAPSVGTFDIDLDFDDSILSFASATFGDQLDILGLGSIAFITPGTATLNLFELSLDTIADLNNLQADAFTLATVTFNTLAVGVSALTLDVFDLGDAAGGALSASVGAGAVNVVPEPSTALLLGSALTGLAISRRRVTS